ncbi:MAG: diaminopimelate dehydrogenase [Ruminococcaceae bacterium]|nr:diaminopimelate dehydrogenase [Oscillospiraceae bacterium]
MIRVGISGYGNLGRGAESALTLCPDMELAAVFTRRDPASLKIATPGVPVVHEDKIAEWAGKIDIMILCGGSATDLPDQGPRYAKYFNTIDSFDTHARVPEYYAAMDEAHRAAGHLGIISVGWDPGLFSLNRMMAGAVLPDGEDYTFWGRGISQGHSDAIRRIPGVLDARQYTIPVEAAMDAVRRGENPQLSTRDKHTRECWVVAEEGADLAEIERQIVTMPNYFDQYDTTVHFITKEELARDHSGMPHAGFVIRSGKTAAGEACTIEYALHMASNPQFTSSAIVAYARAAAKMAARGETGARTVLDVAPALLSPKSGEELRRTIL